jgi:hypothetical protein
MCHQHRIALTPYIVLHLVSLCLSFHYRQPPPQVPTLSPPLPSKPFGRRTAWSTARIKQFQATKKRKILLRKRVLQHLQEVERQQQGKQRRRIRLYIKRCNLARGPEAKPFCSCVLFGEEDYFNDRTEKTDGPSEGFRIILHDGEDTNDSDDSEAEEEDFSKDSDINDKEDRENSDIEHTEADY